MKTGDIAYQLGLYESRCCTAELIFDTGDRFVECPSCLQACRWNLEELLVTTDQLDAMMAAAA